MTKRSISQESFEECGFCYTLSLIDGQQVPGAGAEVDAGHGNALQYPSRVGGDPGGVVGQAERADPGVEQLHRPRPGSNLDAQEPTSLIFGRATNLNSGDLSTARRLSQCSRTSLRSRLCPLMLASR